MIDLFNRGGLKGMCIREWDESDEWRERRGNVVAAKKCLSPQLAVMRRDNADKQEEWGDQDD